MALTSANATTPGYIATDMNGHCGTRTAEEGARVIVQLATLAACALVIS